VYAVERRYADRHNTPHLGSKGMEVPARNGIYADPPNNKLPVSTKRLTRCHAWYQAVVSWGNEAEAPAHP
jgi:hypothetical protein